MHELQFADACKPARFIVLKLQLLPYSLGHELLLLRNRNALILSGFEKTPLAWQRKAVIEAADVCSQTFSENNFRPRTWRQKHLSARAWAKWERALTGLGDKWWTVEIRNMREYIRLGSSSPPIEAADGPAGRQLGAPFHAGLLQFLIQKMGRTEAEAYDYPFGLAKFHYYTHAEAEGGVKIVNAPEMEFDDYCRTEDLKESAAAKAMADQAAKSEEALCQL